MKHQRINKNLFFAMLLSLAALPLIGCDDGAAENAGESIDEAAEDIGESIEEVIE